ncbi:MAG: hypothetical protein ACRETL_01320, partial [Gammaproteobacteria bacterium]
MPDKHKTSKSSHTRPAHAPAKSVKAPTPVKHIPAQAHSPKAAHIAPAHAEKPAALSNGHGHTHGAIVAHANTLAQTHIPSKEEATRAAIEAATADPTSPKNLRLNEKIRHLIRLSKEQG